MENPLESWISERTPAEQELLFALKHFIFSYGDFEMLWKWRTPFFYHQGKPFCYFSLDKKHPHPYLGFVDGHRMAHTALEKDDRKMIKVIHIDPSKDLPMAVLKGLMWEALKLRGIK